MKPAIFRLPLWLKRRDWVSIRSHSHSESGGKKEKREKSMLRITVGVLCLLMMTCSLPLMAQDNTAAAVVPRLVSYSGRVLDEQGKPHLGIAGVTFSIYKDQYEGSPLWLETQNVTADSKGNYIVQLGATKPAGLPLELFASGEARWLGVRVNGGEEQARVLLLSVPYALKAADAQTLGGLPASAFMLAVPSAAVNSTSMVASSAESLTPAVSGTGTTDFIPLWTNSSGALGNSLLFQSGTGSTAKIGVNTTSPTATLDVNGAENVRGALNLPATGPASAAAGKNSQTLSFTASSYNSGTGAAVGQNFRWQAEPAGNNTTSASGTLNLLHAVGANAPTETGLRIAANGQISFAAGQKFPGAATSVALTAPASDFTVTGSPVTGAGTLGLGWKVAPSNVNTANAIVKRDATGSFSAGTITATAPTASGTGISATTVSGEGVSGNASSNGYGVVGTSKAGFGVYGLSNSFPGVGGSSSTNPGVDGTSESSSGVHGYGVNSHGVEGDAHATTGYGVYGTNSAAGGVGVVGSGTVGVYGVSTGANSGVYGTTSGGWALNGYGAAGGTGILTGSAGGWAAWFNGDVNVDGNLSKNGGSFKIDHPLDPANKYLYHSFVESPDMMNIYNGNVTTNAAGEAVVTLPGWFETLNRDFRYQLTVMGQFAQAIVASEVANHQFSIKTDKPGVKVSWQVTGIRQDVWANAHRIPVEEVKPEKERGFYQHPELYGAPQEKSILWSRAPQVMTQWKQAQAKLPAKGQTETSAKP